MTRVNTPCGFVALALLVAALGCDDDALTGPCPAVEVIAITPPEVTVAVGDSAELAVQVATEEDVNADVAWGTADAGIATVNSEGWVTGKSPGETRVFAVATAALDVVQGCQRTARSSAAVTVVLTGSSGTDPLSSDTSHLGLPSVRSTR